MTFSKRFSSASPLHAHPLSKKPFLFTEENQKIAEETLQNYPPGRQASAILPLLDLAQRQCRGWLPPPAIEAVAAYLHVPLIRAYEVATFYTMFNLAPVGKHHIQVCRTISCWLRGASDIQAACEFHLNIKLNEVTPDGKFSLKQVECLGACINAPVVQINDTYYEDLTPESMKAILQNLALNKPGLEKNEKPDNNPQRKPGIDTPSPVKGKKSKTPSKGGDVPC